MTALMSSGEAPSSRKIEPTVSPFFHDDVVFAPVAAAIIRFRPECNVLGHYARLEADIGVSVALGGVTEFQARHSGHIAAGENGRVR